MSDDSMQWSKRKSTASPFFNDANPGQTQSRITSADGPAGGEIKLTDYLNKQNSSGLTNNLGSGVPKKGHDA
jgi:hypothetical protein